MRITLYLGLFALMFMPMQAAAVETTAHHKASIEVSGGFSFPTISMKRPGVVFMTLNAAEDAVLVAAEASEVSHKVEIHTHDMKGGVMRMRQLDKVDIKAGEVVKFKPHGLHLMLMGMKKELKAGDSFKVKLTFKNGKEVDFMALVRPRS